MSRDHRPGRNLLVALVAVLVACLGVGAWLVVENREQSEDIAQLRERARLLSAEQEAEQDALAAARAFVAEVTTYSYKRGEHDFDWVDELHDPEVRERYEPVVADLQRAIRRNRTTARGQVVESAARVVDPTQVEVLAFVDQALTDPSGEVSVEQSSITLTMKLVDGEWRVDEIGFLNALNP
ncbi:hypothetical protein [Nocardioides sp. SYSU DS0651]|uniref:hypothetical protein n=1 Tax=Nocardioides sp. SYSU DS0651 TaxID=3415955 RepID=UPI003F4C4C1C